MERGIILEQAITQDENQSEYGSVNPMERFKVCLPVRSGPSIPIEFPRKCTSVNPRYCTYGFPRRCISVNPRKSVIFTYEFPRMCISVNPHNCTYEFPRKCISVNTRKCISVNPRKCISVKSTIILYACIQ
jgi:hypothetical protein